MFRTRDFVLVFTAVAFLLMAIGVTVFQKRAPQAISSEIILAQQIISDEPAEIQPHSNLSRSEKLQSMREKIAASEQLSITNEPPEIASEATTSDDKVVVVEAEKELLLCGNYRASAVAWSPNSVQIEEVEGARIVHRTNGRNSAINTQATTSANEPTVNLYQEILLQLPIRTFPAASKSCIATDVIGIANDGSLIRNAEAGLYGIFGSNTIVGYALDGFPIYGSGSGATDACGGSMGVAGYQYQISAERDTIINCFSAAPVPF